MSKPYPESFDHMLAAWNERDQSRIRVHLEHALAPDAEFVDPTIVTRGIDEFESNVREFRSRFPLASAARTSGIDSHHHVHRYSWHIVAEGKVVVQGFDVVETDASNKVRRVLGFFGPLPRLVD